MSHFPDIVPAQPFVLPCFCPRKRRGLCNLCDLCGAGGDARLTRSSDSLACTSHCFADNMISSANPRSRLGGPGKVRLAGAQSFRRRRRSGLVKYLPKAILTSKHAEQQPGRLSPLKSRALTLARFATKSALLRRPGSLLFRRFRPSKLRSCYRSHAPAALLPPDSSAARRPTTCALCDLYRAAYKANKSRFISTHVGSSLQKSSVAASRAKSAHRKAVKLSKSTSRPSRIYLRDSSSLPRQTLGDPNMEQQPHTGTSSTREMERFENSSDSSGYYTSSGVSASQLAQRDANWRQSSELRVDFDGVPQSFVAKDIVALLKPYGNVVAVIIFTSYAGRSKGRGICRFSPPPSVDFWKDSLPLQFEGRNYRVRFTVKPSNRYTLPGLVNTERTYPSSMHIEGESFSAGCFLGSNKMLVLFETSSYPKLPAKAHRFLPLTISQNLEFRELIFSFPIHFDTGPNEDVKLKRTEAMRLVLSLKQRMQIFQVDFSQHKTKQLLIFRTETPPRCLRKMDDAQISEGDPHSWNERESLFRQVDVVLDPRSPSFKKKPTSLRQDLSIINIGRWTTYCVILNLEQISHSKLEQFYNSLRDHNIVVQQCPGFKATGNKPAEIWQLIDPPSSSSERDDSFMALASENPRITSLAFDIRYQLEVCISGGWLNEYTLTSAWVQKLQSLETDRACALLEFVATDSPWRKSRRIEDPFSIFTLSVPKQSVFSRKRPDWCSVVRTATVTPTTIIFNTPAVEISNRVIRYYSEHADRFLRVRFLDEKGQGRIHSAMNSKVMDEVFTRIKRTLANGIAIGDRHYDFLAWGNSQFRENGAYFFSSTAALSADKIRQWMGNFEHINVVAKYAARLGQCFSTTRAIRSARPNLSTIPDVERNGYQFTDGVGKMSKVMALMAADDFGIKLHFGEPPSVFQFRLGGFKGVLAWWPEIKGLEVQMRPSQDKFKTSKNDLEIIRYSQPASLFLNRQLITVLSNLGVPDEVFLGKMKIQLSRIHKAMHDEFVAREALLYSVDVNQISPLMAEMVCSGFQSTREPFMMTLLHLWRAWSVKYLREKAKLSVPQGTILLGCVDETDTLKGHFEGLQDNLRSKDITKRLEALPEVFVQVSNFDQTGRSKVIEGLMILARNPSLHIGDIRVVKGVNCKRLSHLKDTVVLPRTGDRDLANMCSGGDLDGDDFIVSWDPDLIPVEWNRPAMDFTPLKPVTKDKVTIDQITSFFVQYMKNADLPSIAYAHLATADAEELGVRSEKCLRLAELHSNAVDYPKTGQPASMTPDLRVRRWPHFMEKKPKVSYHSQKVLGKLYDDVECVSFAPCYDNPFDSRILQSIVTTPEQDSAARELKTQYDAAVRRVMAQYEIKTEFEVWTAFVLEYGKSVGSKYNFATDLGQVVSALKEQHRNMCIERAGSRDLEDLGPLVASMYKITMEEMAQALEECKPQQSGGSIQPAKRHKIPSEMPLMSFPWLFPWILGKIACGAKFGVTLRGPGLELHAIRDAVPSEFGIREHETQFSDFEADSSNPSGSLVVPTPRSGSSAETERMVTSAAKDLQGIELDAQPKGLLKTPEEGRHDSSGGEGSSGIMPKSSDAALIKDSGSESGDQEPVEAPEGLFDKLNRLFS